MNENQIIIASENGDIHVLNRLIEERVNVSYKNDLSLRIVSLYGYIDCLKLILQQPSINIHANEDEALMLACQSNNYEASKILIDHGANVNACNNYAIQIACKNRNLYLVRLLVINGANIHFFNDLALRYTNVKIARYLISLNMNYFIKQQFRHHIQRTIRREYKKYVKRKIAFLWVIKRLKIQDTYLFDLNTIRIIFDLL
jgi:ankyrin repeat protein